MWCLHTLVARGFRKYNVLPRLVFKTLLLRSLTRTNAHRKKLTMQSSLTSTSVSATFNGFPTSFCLGSPPATCRRTGEQQRSLKIKSNLAIASWSLLNHHKSYYRLLKLNVCRDNGRMIDCSTSGHSHDTCTAEPSHSHQGATYSHKAMKLIFFSLLLREH